MHALILAAGLGSRLAQGVPKCLIEVGGRPLLSHQLDAVRGAGAERVTIVTGHGDELVRSMANDDVRFVLNDRYADTNSLYSFWLAREAVSGELLVLNCDVLFPYQVLDALLECEGSSLAFDSGSGRSAEHMKVCMQGRRLVEMSKQLCTARTSGENLGLLRLSEEAAVAAFDAAAELLRRRRCERDWVGEAINLVARRHRIACVDVAGVPWVEIDYPHDLAAARSEIWPAIEAFASAPPQRVPFRATRRRRLALVPAKAVAG